MEKNVKFTLPGRVLSEMGWDDPHYEADPGDSLDNARNLACQEAEYKKHGRGGYYLLYASPKVALYIVASLLDKAEANLHQEDEELKQAGRALIKAAQKIKKDLGL